MTAEVQRHPDAACPFLAAAIEAAELGLRVVPVAPRGKKPIVKRWPTVASSDPTVLRRMWARNPEANIGIACGNGLVVVDTDSRAGEDAVRQLGVSEVPTVKTARGRHFYFRGEAATQTGLLPGVDIRGAGGVVVGAGSVHESGLKYRWEKPPAGAQFPPVPEKLLDLLTSRSKSASKGSGRRGPLGMSAAMTLHEPIAPGERNNTLFRIACSLRGRSGLHYEEILAALQAANESRCAPPLSHGEVEKIARSAACMRAAPLWTTDPLAFARDPELLGTTRFLLVALSRYANAEGVCWPGYQLLHRDTGFAKNTIARAIDSLISAGRIEVARGGRKKSNNYRLLPPTATKRW